MNQIQMAGPMPGQSPMPGQAQGIQQMLPGMQRQGPQAASPQAMVAPLSQMPMQQLMQLMLNPRPDGPPLYAVISAISEQQKKAQAQAAMQRQGAMAQGQQAAQQPPVAQEVMAQAQQMQEPVMAAYGGEMHGYAGGGAVAFDRGGNPEIERILRKSPYDRTPEENEKLRAAGIDVVRRQPAPDGSGISALNKVLESPFLRSIFSGGSYTLSPEELAARSDPGALTEKMYRGLGGQQYTEPAKGGGRGTMTPPMAASEEGQRLAGRLNAPTEFALDPNNPQALNALRRAAMTAGGQEREDLLAQIAQMRSQLPQSRPMAGPSTSVESATQGPSAAPSLPVPARPTPAELPPEMQKMYADREAEMRRRLTRPESLVAAEQGLAALAKSNIEAQQAEAKTYGEEIRAARDAAMAKAQRGFLDDPQALLSLAGSIDTRRGRGLGSLARGAAGIMGGKEAAAEAARKEFAMAQRDERAMQANLRQTQMLEAQRQVALEQGKLNEVNAINDKLAELGMEREKFRLTRGDKEFEQAIQTGQLENQRIQAEAAKTSAGKLSGTAQLLKDLGLAPTIENIERLSRAQYAARGDAALDRNEIARQRLLNEDMVYAGARMAYVNATDPVKKAEALRKMKEIERLNGIVDDGAMSSAAPVGSATLPPGFKLDK